MQKLDLYITFRREPKSHARPGNIMQFAQVTFGGATPTEPQLRGLVNRFGALTCCSLVRYDPDKNRLLISAVGLGEPDEKKFIDHVLACANKHYTVRRMTRPRP